MHLLWYLTDDCSSLLYLFGHSSRMETEEKPEHNVTLYVNGSWKEDATRMLLTKIVFYLPSCEVEMAVVAH